MKKEIPDANLKLSEETVFMLKDMNHRLIRSNFNNLKTLNSVAIFELEKKSKKMSDSTFYTYVITQTSILQSKGFIKSNTRSIGKKK